MAGATLFDVWFENSYVENETKRGNGVILRETINEGIYLESTKKLQKTQVDTAKYNYEKKILRS